MIRRSLFGFLELQNLLHTRARKHVISPLLDVRVLLLVKLFIRNSRLGCVLPRKEGNVDVGYATPQEPGVSVRVRLLLGQVLLEHTSHAVDLFDVALARLWKWLIDNKPHGLPVVRSLAGGLVEEPLTSVVGFSCAQLEAELVVLVVFLGQVLDDSARLPQREVCVWILDARQTPVRVDGDVLGVLDIGEGDYLRLIRQS